MTKLTTLSQIHKLQDRYPFDEEEMEILVRCHDQLEEATSNGDDERDFLVKLAKASPYVYYFVPGNELHDRIVWIEDHILPMGFTSSFRAAITSDPFVSYANQGQNTSLERLIEGIADVTGRRGSKTVLHILYKIADKAEDESTTIDELIDLCVRLSVACDALIDPKFDKHSYLKALDTTGVIVSNIMMKSLKSSLLNREQPYTNKEGLEEGAGSNDDVYDEKELDSGYDNFYDSGYDGDDSSNEGLAGGVKVDFCGMIVKESSFIDFAETVMPMLSSPLSTFIHHLIFHQIQYPTNRFSLHYTKPVIKKEKQKQQMKQSVVSKEDDELGGMEMEVATDRSDIDSIDSSYDDGDSVTGDEIIANSIFCDKTAEKSSLLFLLTMISSKFSGKTMTKLYSTETDGRSFNRLEYSILGYDGPTMVTIKTTEGAVIGAYTETPWKDSINYFGSDECFMFQIMPQLKVLRPTGNGENNFMYMHSNELHKSPISPPDDGLPHGLGFGGNLHTKPRLFIPESLEGCSATFMDKTYDIGQLLPEEVATANLEKFEINVMEIWGVGYDEDHAAHDNNTKQMSTATPETSDTTTTTATIQYALQQRDEYRNRLSNAITRARVLKDKSQFVKDLESGLIPTKNLYSHREHARGRNEFRVDEKHGGYKIDRE